MPPEQDSPQPPISQAALDSFGKFLATQGPGKESGMDFVGRMASSYAAGKDPFAEEQAPQQEAQPAPHDQGLSASDYGVAFRKALDRTGAAMGYGLQKVGLDSLGGSIRDFYHEREQSAPEQSAAFHEVENTPWTEAITSPGMAVKKLAADAASALPDTALTIGTSIGTGGLAGLAKVPALAGKIIGGAGGGVAFGLGDAERSARELEEMPEDRLRQTPAFVDAYSKTDPSLPEDVRVSQARNDAANTVASAAMRGNIGIGALSGGLLGPAAEKIGQAIPGKIGNAIANAGEASAFMGGQNTASNAVRKEYIDPNTSLTEGLPSALIGGAVFGGAHGLVKGERPNPVRKAAEVVLEGDPQQQQNNASDVTPEDIARRATPVDDVFRSAGVADKPEWQQALSTYDALTENQNSISRAMGQGIPVGEGGRGPSTDQALGPALERAWYDPSQVDERYQRGLQQAATVSPEAISAGEKGAAPFPKTLEESSALAKQAQEQAETARQAIIDAQNEEQRQIAIQQFESATQDLSRLQALPYGGQDFNMVPDVERRDLLPVKLDESPTMPAQSLTPQEQSRATELQRRIDNLTALLDAERNPAARARIEGTRTGYEVELRNLTGGLEGQSTQAGVQYSTGSEATPRPYTTEDVTKAFPTGTVTETPEGHSVALPNGESIHVNRVGELSLDESTAQAGGYAPEETTGAKPVASFKPIDGGGIISLTEAGGQELPHETYHAAEAMALTPREIAAVEKAHGNAEGRARAYQDWLAGKGEDKTGVFAKIKEFFQRIREWIAPTAAGTFRKVASGEVWDREAQPAQGGEQYKLSSPSLTFDNPDSERRYREAAKGIGDQRGLIERGKDWLGEQAAGFSRHFIHMPNIPQYAEAHEALRQLEAAPTAAKEEAVRNLRTVTGKLSPGAYDLFTRKVVLDDLAHEASLGHDLPFGFTPEAMAKEKAKVDRWTENVPEVKDALATRKSIMDDLTGKLVDAGILSEDQVKNPAYFRHEVLKYAREWQNSQGTGSALKKPKPGYAKGRDGSTEDISANYLEAEYAFMQRAAVDLKTAETLKKIQGKYDTMPQVKTAAQEANTRALAAMGMDATRMTEGQKKEALGAKYKTWDSMIPEGYDRFQADKGLVYHTGNSITDKAMLSLMDTLQMDDKAFQAQAPEVVLDVLNGVRQQLMVGGKKPEMILPKPIVETLNNLRPKSERSFFDQALSKPLGMWKQWVLVNPRRVLKYNLNNMAGDLDAVIAGNPKTLTRLPEAIRELRDVMRGGDPSQDYKDAVARGVFDSGLSIQEIPDIAKLDAFQNLVAERSGKNSLANPLTWARKGWRTLQDYTQFRENWMRLAAYKDYLRRIEAGEDMKSIGYGAADPKIVDALSDPKDKAAMLARTLVGDYGAVSHYGQGLRNKVIPFYSWMEVNAKRYGQLIKNAFDQGIGQGFKTAGLTGAALGTRASVYLGLRMAAMYGLISAYNHLFHKDEEETLSPLDQQQLHVILGRDKGGNVHTLRLQGALSDFLGWFGFSDAVGAMKEIQNGRGSYADVLKAVAKAPVNKVASGLSPFLKTPLELAMGQSTYPDVFNPRPMQDRAREAARLFSAENEYDALRDKPTRGYWQSWLQAVDYSRNVGEIAFNNTMDRIRDFKESKGIEGAGTSSTPKSRVIREYKQALRYGDEQAAQAAMEKMRAQGVTSDDMEKSLIRSAPLAGLARKDRAEFLETLTPKEQEQVKAADEWYKDTFLDTDTLKTKYNFHEMEADYNLLHRQQRELVKAGRYAEANKLKMDNDLSRKGNLISMVNRIKAMRKKVSDSRLPDVEKVRRMGNFDGRIKEVMERALTAVR